MPFVTTHWISTWKISTALLCPLSRVIQRGAKIWKALRITTPHWFQRWPTPCSILRNRNTNMNGCHSEMTVRMWSLMRRLQQVEGIDRRHRNFKPICITFPYTKLSLIYPFILHSSSAVNMGPRKILSSASWKIWGSNGSYNILVYRNSWLVYRMARVIGKVVRFQHRGTHWWAAPLYQKQRNRSGLNNWLVCLASWYTSNFNLCKQQGI